MNKEELYKLAIETYGDEAQINQGIEEMAGAAFSGGNDFA